MLSDSGEHFRPYLLTIVKGQMKSGRVPEVCLSFTCEPLWPAGAGTGIQPIFLSARKTTRAFVLLHLLTLWQHGQR